MKRKGILCLVDLHKYEEISDKSYFPYYKCKKCGKKIDPMTETKTSLKDVLSWVGIILFLIFMIGSLILIKTNEERIVKDVSVEFVKFKESNNELYAVYVSHEEKAYFNLKLSSYERNYEEKFFKSITIIESVSEGIGSDDYKYYILIDEEKRQLSKHE